MYESNNNFMIVGSYPELVGIYAQSSSFISLRTSVQLLNELFSYIIVGCNHPVTHAALLFILVTQKSRRTNLSQKCHVTFVMGVSPCTIVNN